MAKPESLARQAFNGATRKLESALSEYAAARKRLLDGGEFIAADKNTALQFSTGGNGKPTVHMELPDVVLADC